MEFNPYHDYIFIDRISALGVRETGWIGEAVYRCGFAAVELALGLADGTLADRRGYGYLDERVDHICDCIVTQVGLVAEGLGLEPPPDGVVASVPTRQSRFGDSALLTHGPAHRSEPLRAGAGAALTRMPLRCGLEAVIGTGDAGRARLHRAAVREGDGWLPYDAWVEPAALRRLLDEPCAGPEDLVFRTVHQISECWFRVLIDLLGYARNRARDRQKDQAARAVRLAARVLYFLSVHIRLLDRMDLRDYHPLRVGLKGSSGAQSEAAGQVVLGVRQLGEFCEPPRDEVPGGVAALFAEPERAPADFHYADALGMLDVALSEFLFSHYCRALRVQSRNGLGALGEGTDGLLQRAVRPLFPALDQARFTHLAFSNWLCAGDQGTLVARGESRAGVPVTLAPGVDDEAAARKLTAALVEAFAARDVESCVALFGDSGGVADPAGSRPYAGTAGTRNYFASVFQTLTEVRLSSGRGRWDGTGLVTALEVDTTTFTGSGLTLPLTWRLVPAGPDQVAALTCDWDTGAVARALLDRPAPAARSTRRSTGRSTEHG